MVIHLSVKAAERWMATDSGSQDTGQATWLEENIILGDMFAPQIFLIYLV